MSVQLRISHTTKGNDKQLAVRVVRFNKKGTVVSTDSKPLEDGGEMLVEVGELTRVEIVDESKPN